MPLNSLLQAFKSKDTRPVKALRVGVLGGGRMGQFHLKHLSKNPHAILAGVADTDSGRRQSLSKQFKIPAFSDPGSLSDS